MSTSIDHADIPPLGPAMQVLRKVSEARSVPNFDQVLEICKPNRGNQWTVEDEEAAALEVAASEDFRAFSAALERLSRRNLERLVAISKICTRLYKMSPLEIFSADFGVKFGRIRATDDSQHPCLWSSTITEKLNMLLLHPLFIGREASHEFLILVLQFTSICRTRDCRPWDVPRLEHSGTIPQIDALREAVRGLKASDGTTRSNITSPYTVLGNICRQTPSSHLPTEVSLLLHIIDITMSIHATGSRATIDQQGRMLYEILVTDLSTIIKAISQIQPLQVSAEAARNIWHGINTQVDKKVRHLNASTFVEMFIISYKHLQTHRLLRCRNQLNPSLEKSEVDRTSRRSGSGLDAQHESRAVVNDLSIAPCAPELVHDQVATAVTAPVSPSQLRMANSGDLGFGSTDLSSISLNQPDRTTHLTAIDTTNSSAALPEIPSPCRSPQHIASLAPDGGDVAIDNPECDRDDGADVSMPDACPSPLLQSSFLRGSIEPPERDQDSKIHVAANSTEVVTRNSVSDEDTDSPAKTTYPNNLQPPFRGNLAAHISKPPWYDEVPYRPIREGTSFESE